MDSDRFQKNYTLPFRSVTFVSTIAALYTLVVRHLIKLRWIEKFNVKGKKIERIYLQYEEEIVGDPRESMSHYTYLGSSAKPLLNEHRRKLIVRKNFITDLLILIICPVPFYERYVCSTIPSPF
jgi:hypothetical protein